MKTIFSLVISIFMLIACKPQSNQYNIVDFGATTDTTKLSTSAINKSIEECTKNGGGTVYVPKGIFYSGTILLKSNVSLYLETGAVIKGSRDTADYMIDGRKYGLILAKNCKNVTIEGHGQINGNGTFFHDATKPHLGGGGEAQYTRQGDDYMNLKYGIEDGPIRYRYRPGMMVVFSRCENVKVKDVTLRDTPEWTSRFADCDNVEISGVSIQANLLIPNSDGLHCTNSRNIRISNCDIRCGDDAIIVSGFDDLVGVHGEVRKDDNVGERIGNKTGYAENVVVSNCLLQSRSAGIRVGYGEHNIRNCIFSNLVIYGSNRGIGVFARDTASIENIQFSDIQIQTRLHKGSWWGKGEPIHVSCVAQKAENPVGTIKNIRFTNINMTAETGVIVFSEEANKMDNIQFNNCQLLIKKSPIDLTYGGNIDLRPTVKPQMAVYKSDIPGFYVYNVSNFKMKDIEMNWESNLASYFTDGLYCKNVIGGFIDNFAGKGASTSYKGMKLENSKIDVD